MSRCLCRGRPSCRSQCHLRREAARRAGRVGERDGSPSRWGARSLAAARRHAACAHVADPDWERTRVGGQCRGQSWSDLHASRNEQRDANTLRALVEARAAVTDEAVQSEALATAAGVGPSAIAITKSLGIDLVANVSAARAKVDASSALRTYPTLAADVARLDLLRPQIDAGHATFAAIDALIGPFTTDIDTMWQNGIDHLGQDVNTSTQGGPLAARTEALTETFSALTTGLDAVRYANTLAISPSTPANVEALIEMTSLLATSTKTAAALLGPKSAAAWRSLGADPATIRFQRIIDQVVQATLTGAPPPFATNLLGFAAAFKDSLKWIDDLTVAVEAASADVRDLASQHETATQRHLLGEAGSVLALAVISLVGAALLARAIDRPLKRLAESALQISQGHFALLHIPPESPREAAATIAAVNDMTATLAAIETYALTLAENPTSPLLDKPLPGPTGQALQTTLDKLQESIHTAEQHRRMLQEVATHDGLTGLLNRTAAIEAVDRDLARCRRDCTTMMVLFIDLDDLKSINDTYSHAIGDNAIRLTADTLRATTRLSDVVARLGGDEFLVSGIVSQGAAEAQALTERLHQAVGGRSLVADRAVIALHCSIGIALAEPDDTVESVIHRADQALYQAKQHGRNRIEWHTGSAIPAKR